MSTTSQMTYRRGAAAWPRTLCFAQSSPNHRRGSSETLLDGRVGHQQQACFNHGRDPQGKALCGPCTTKISNLMHSLLNKHTKGQARLLKATPSTAQGSNLCLCPHCFCIMRSQNAWRKISNFTADSSKDVNMHMPEVQQHSTTAPPRRLASVCMCRSDPARLCRSSPVGASLTASSLSENGSVPGFSVGQEGMTGKGVGKGGRYAAG